MQVVINNILTSYNDIGQGQALVCLHGWMSDKSSFQKLAKELSDDMRIISVDLPNFGDSQKTDTVTSIEEYAAFVRDFIQKLEISSYVLAGHSMGGQIAVYGTGESVLTPSHLILISAAGVRDQKKVTKAVMTALAKVASPILPKSLKRKFYRLIGSDYTPDLSVTHKLIIKQVLNTDVQDLARKIMTPTELIYGEFDVSTSVDMARRLQSCIKGSKLIILDGQQHWPHEMAAEEVATQIRGFTKI